MSEQTCPTCKQPMPREATTANPHRERGAPVVQCEFCEKPACFILRKCATCYEHREKAAQ